MPLLIILLLSKIFYLFLKKTAGCLGDILSNTAERDLRNCFLLMKEEFIRILYFSRKYLHIEGTQLTYLRLLNSPHGILILSALFEICTLTFFVLYKEFGPRLSVLQNS